MRKCYLVTTEHLEEGLWFRDEEDFTVGMNYVAIQASCNRVKVLSFILMSNHLHFVLIGEFSEIVDFINGIKTRYGKYLNKKYGINEFLRRNKIDIREISKEDEGVERAIAYVQMNSVAANICSHPIQYPWGSGDVFFSTNQPSGRLLKSLSKRSRSKILHSRYSNLPEEWLIGEGAYILPSSYIEVEAVEKIFRSPKRMNYFLMNSSKARQRVITSEDNTPAFRDQTIIASIPDLCRSLFRKKDMGELIEKEKGELLRQLRFRFCASINQMARICNLGYAEIANLLDTV